MGTTMNFRAVLNILTFPRIPANAEKGKKKRCKRAIKQTANGNILLQKGFFLTEEDVENEKRVLLT